MSCPKSLKEAHEKVQNNIFVMLPEKWERLYLYASVIEYLDDMPIGEMFFYYFPKGVLKKKPINVYEVPAKFNIDEKQYFKLSDELYASIKNLREECIKCGEKPWSNITISIEELKYKVEYGYEDLNSFEFSSNARRIIWSYKYLQIPYQSLNKKERQLIDKYERIERSPRETFELPLYNIEKRKESETVKKIEKSLTFVTDETIEEMEFKQNHVPKSQILSFK